MKCTCMRGFSDSDCPAPRILDVYCGAGGAGMGYYRAGWHVVGTDLHPQPNYPFEFHQADALEVLAYSGEWISQFQAAHTSPPCQAWSKMSNCRPGLSEKYPALIEPTRELLQKHWSDVPWVIENVEGAPLVEPIMLCGHMFGYELYRHRYFESNVQLTAPMHPAHVKPASKAGHWKPGTIMSVSGHVAPVKLAREVMDMDWTTRDELAEAIPPYYTEHIGRQLITALRSAA